MKNTRANVERYFRPLLGTQPWKVKLGVGSFLTLEFGPRMRAFGHIHGKWHLWIYLSNWTLFHGKRQLVDSDTDRKIIAPAVRRLQEAALSSVKLDLRTKTITLLFDDFRLVVSPADYLDDVSDRDAYWIFFMPEGEVLSMGPSGLKLEQEDARASVSRKQQEERIRSLDLVREVRFED